MVNIADLRPGDMVRIVDHWGPECYANPNGQMDHWLGQIMTVRGLSESLEYALMQEDDGEFNGGGWSWFPEAIAEVVMDNEEQDYEAASDEELEAFLFG